MAICRVMIIGAPGSGKTWLARRLAQQLQLPVYSVDDAVWDENGKLREADEIDRLVRAVVFKDCWVMREVIHGLIRIAPIGPN